MYKSEDFLHNNRFLFFIIIYFLLLFTSAFFLVQNFAVFYYWDWGRHLALSYYDAPPMFAYMLRAVTSLFGSHLYVINLLADVFVALICFMVYKIARLIVNRESALVAACLWLVTPLTTQFMVRYVTYDAPLNLFWAATIFFVTKFILENKFKYLYLTGLCIGLMMFTKYTGALLVFALLLFLAFNKKYRWLYCCKHFYFSCAIALLFFLPVIIWNIQHDWISFTYHIHIHDIGKQSLTSHFHEVFIYLFSELLPAVNFLLFVLFYGFYKSKDDKSFPMGDVGKLFCYIITFFYTFYFFASFKIHVQTPWLMPGSIVVAILAAFFIFKYKLKKTLIAILSFYVICSFLILLIDTVFKKEMTIEFARMALAKEFSIKHPVSKNVPLFTDGYSSARMVFFMKGQPNVYAIGDDSNQYELWTKPVINKIKKGEIKQAIFFSQNPDFQGMLKYFKFCKPFPKIVYKQKRLFGHKIRKTFVLYSYLCTNS